MGKAVGCWLLAIGCWLGKCIAVVEAMVGKDERLKRFEKFEKC